MNMDNESYRAFWSVQVGRVVKALEDESARARRENTERNTEPRAGAESPGQAQDAAPKAGDGDRRDGSIPSTGATPAVPAPASAQAAPSRDEVFVAVEQAMRSAPFMNRHSDAKRATDAAIALYAPVLSALRTEVEWYRDVETPGLAKLRDAAVAERDEARKQRDHWRKQNSARLEELTEERENVAILKRDIEKRRSARPAAMDRDEAIKKCTDKVAAIVHAKPGSVIHGWMRAELIQHWPSPRAVTAEDVRKAVEVATGLAWSTLHTCEAVAAALNKRTGPPTPQSSGNPGTLPAAPPPSETPAVAFAGKRDDAAAMMYWHERWCTSEAEVEKLRGDLVTERRVHENTAKQLGDSDRRLAAIQRLIPDDCWPASLDAVETLVSRYYRFRDLAEENSGHIPSDLSWWVGPGKRYATLAHAARDAMRWHDEAQAEKLTLRVRHLIPEDIKAVNIGECEGAITTTSWYERLADALNKRLDSRAGLESLLRSEWPSESLEACVAELCRDSGTRPETTFRSHPADDVEAIYIEPFRKRARAILSKHWPAHLAPATTPLSGEQLRQIVKDHAGMVNTLDWNQIGDPQRTWWTEHAAKLSLPGLAPAKIRMPEREVEPLAYETAFVNRWLGHVREEAAKCADAGLVSSHFETCRTCEWIAKNIRALDIDTPPASAVRAEGGRADG